MDLSKHQYRGGVQYMATKTAQGVVSGCIYLGKLYFIYNIKHSFLCPALMNQYVPEILLRMPI